MTVIRLHCNPPEDHGPTVASIISLYLAYDRARSKPGPALKERARVLSLFAEQHGYWAVSECLPTDLEDWVLANPGWVSNHTKRRAATTVKAAFDWAVKRRRISVNPFAGVKFRRGRRGRDIRASEFQALLRTSSPAFRRILIYLRMTGSRPGEMRALLWTHISEEISAAVLNDHKTAETRGEYEPRRIFFSDCVLKLLAWMRRRDPIGEYVFTNRCGRPWTLRTLCKLMQAVRERAGLGKDVRAYGCRHAYGSNAILNGVDLATLAELMGHSDIASTMIYVHLARHTGHLRTAAGKASRNH